MIRRVIRVSRKIVLLTIILLFSLCAFAEAANTENAQAPPPPGWQAAGESVAGPEETSAVLQTTARDSADIQIQHQRDTQIQKTDNKGYIYYGIAYKDYDERPYANDPRRPITPGNINEHVNYGSNNRVRRKDVYIYTE
ncbi:MAG: hypothetical protein U9R44_04230 [Candidatus Omnitrophota bacterium]|nr:hypothetical protein [Candidatus Omnitrophota bacterium]